MACPAYLIFGADEFLVASKAKEILDAIMPASRQALGLEVIDARAAESADAAQKALSECLGALRTVSFLGDGKVVWLRDAPFLAFGALKGSAESAKARLRDLAQAVSAGLPAGQVLMVTAPAVHKASALFKACKEKGECHEFDIPEKDWEADRQASETLKGLLGAAGLRMSADVQGVFLGTVGNDTRELSAELEKLSAYMGGRKDVREDDIEAVSTSARSLKVWDLTEAVGLRDLSRALEIVRQLLFQREAAIGIVMVLERHIRDLIAYRDALDGGWLALELRGRRSATWRVTDPRVLEALTELLGRDPTKLHPFRMLKLAEQANATKRPRLVAWRRLLAEAHARLVSSSISESVVLETTLVKMLA